MEQRFSVPPLGRVNKNLLIVVVGLFLLSSILEVTLSLRLSPILGLTAKSFWSGQIYQIMTYPLIANGLVNCVFNGLILWFIGSTFEVTWGEKRYISFLVCSSLGGGLFFILISTLFFTNSPLAFYPLTGLTGVCSALCIAYATIYPDRLVTFMFLFPMKAKVFCFILIGMELYQGLFSPGGILSWGHIGTMISGFLMLLYFARKRLKRPKFLGSLTKKNKHHFKVIDGGKKSPRYYQ